MKFQRRKELSKGQNGKTDYKESEHLSGTKSAYHVCSPNVEAV